MRFHETELFCTDYGKTTRFYAMSTKLSFLKKETTNFNLATQSK